MSLDVYLTGGNGSEFSENITHNLNKMAEAAGIYYHLWRPEEIGISKAGQLIEPLTKALADMCLRPTFYETFNAANGWGLYVHFLPWIARYLEACVANPDGDIEVSR